MLRRRQLQAVFGAAIVALGLGASSLVASASTSAKTANVVAAPANNLHNGQTTWVQGSGFPKSTPNNPVSIAVIQCNPKVANPKIGSAACNIGGVVLTRSTVTGRLAATALKVHTGTIGSGKGAGLCNATHFCYAVASTLDMSTAGIFAIHFAP